MIKANKNKYFESLFSVYNKYILKRNFHKIYINKDSLLPAFTGKTLIFANHSNWWDGLIAFYLSYNLWKCNAYLMMDESQMKKYTFFKYIGAFSVNKSSYLESFGSLLYAIELLNKNNSTLWIFPQGKMEHQDKRPFQFEKGINKIINDVKDLKIYSLAFNYSYLMEQYPEVFINIKEYKSTKSPEDHLQKELSQQKEKIINYDLDSYKVILNGRNSRNKIIDKVYD